MDLNATQTKLDTLGDYDDQVLGLKREVRLLTAEKNDMLVRINYLEPLYPLYRDYLPSYIRLAFFVLLFVTKFSMTGIFHHSAPTDVHALPHLSAPRRRLLALDLHRQRAPTSQMISARIDSLLVTRLCSRTIAPPLPIRCVGLSTKKRWSVALFALRLLNVNHANLTVNHCHI